MVHILTRFLRLRSMSQIWARQDVYNDQSATLFASLLAIYSLCAINLNEFLSTGSSETSTIDQPITEQTFYLAAYSF